MTTTPMRLACGVMALGSLLACDDGDQQPPSQAAPSSAAGSGADTGASAVQASPAEGASVMAGAPGLHVEGDSLIFRTEPFTVPAGEEHYMCWPATVDQAVKVKGFEYAGRPVVHHFLFSRTAAPEPDGFSECDVLFKNSWRPVFAAGAGNSELTFPDGAAHEFPAGAQLVVQLHLLNSTGEDITDVAEVVMTTTDEADTEPVVIGVLGTRDISLPPGAASTITAECTIPRESRVIGLMPHMHYLGTSLTLELGDSADDMQMIYQRDPYDFDQQTIDRFDLSLNPGQVTRVSCSYDNTTPQTVTFGDSSLEEMCYLVTFSVGTSTSCASRPPEQ